MKNPFDTSFYGEKIISGNSDCHSYEFVLNDKYGVSFFLDGILQSTQKDQFIYHSNMVNRAELINDRPERILIIGGAGGGLLPYLLLRFNETVREICIVDIDEALFNLSRKLLPSWHKGTFDDSRVYVQYGDGLEFLKKNDNQFDLIFCDISDNADWTESSKFYNGVTDTHLGKNLSSSGGLVFQSPILQGKMTPFSLSNKNSLIALDDPLEVRIRSFEHRWQFGACIKTSG